MIGVWQKMCFGLIFLAAMLVAVGNGFAAGKEDQTVVILVGEMKRALKLTDEQAKQITSSVRAYFQQVQELKTERLVNTELESRMKSLRDDMDSDLGHYLTEEQMTLWKSHTERPQERGNRVSDGKGDVLAGDKINPPATETRSQNDNGVLESTGPNKTKSSGVW